MDSILKEKYIDAVMNKDKVDLFMISMNLPTSIFRYRAGTRKNSDGSLCDLTLLAQDKIFLASAGKQNDENDSLVFWNAVEEEKRLTGDNKWPLDLIVLLQNELDYKFVSQMQMKTYIACFTEIAPKIAEAQYFWENYANDNKGFCIEYAFEDFFTCLFPVVYKDKFDREVKQETIITKILTTKEYKWSKEKEWRIIKMGKGEEEVFPTPKRIYLGKECCRNEELYEGLKKIALEKKIEIIQL